MQASGCELDECWGGYSCDVGGLTSSVFAMSRLCSVCIFRRSSRAPPSSPSSLRHRWQF